MSADRIRVACGQFAPSTDPQENLRTATELIRAAGEAGSALVVLPEGAMANFAAPIGTLAEPVDGPFATGIREAARAAGLVAVVGMYEPAAGGRCHNTLLVTGTAAGGPVEATYRKVHLFDAFGIRESDTVSRGEDYVLVDVAGVRVGLATCYDVRFADQFTELGLRGAQVVVLPAAWADGPGKAEQWDLLTRARAMDAQAWLVASGQAWQPPIGTAPLGIGRSVVADPLGGVRARLGSAPDLLVADLDLSLVDAVRARVPVLEGIRTRRESGA